MSKGKEETKRDSNIINVSGKGDRKFTFFVFLAKKILESYETVELHSIGQACPYGVQAAENLCRHGYTTLDRIYTETVELESGFKRAKLFIVLKKTKDFDKINQNWEAGKEERKQQK